MNNRSNTWVRYKPVGADVKGTLATVAAGRVIDAWARSAYGVVVGDAAATASLRRAIRAARVRGTPPALAAEMAEGGGEPIGTALEVVHGALACRRCGTALADAH